MATIEILSWNVNGIRAVEKKGFLDWLHKTSPHILCLQETKAHVDQLSDALKDPKPYSVHWDSAERKGYSGVATFSNIQFKSVKNGLGIDRFDREGRTLVSDFGDFVLFNVYFPNGQMNDDRLKFKMDFYDAMLETAKKVRRRGQGVIISGDVNTAHKPIDLARPKENEHTSGFLPQERAWIDKLVAAGFVDSLRVFRPEPDLYTWWDMKSRARERNVGWRIDYHFVSEDLASRLKDAYILPEVTGSDHCPVGIKLQI